MEKGDCLCPYLCLWTALKLAYKHGKGRLFVPVLVPVDCVEAIDILVENRPANGVTVDNRFLFASRGIHAWMFVKKKGVTWVMFIFKLLPCLH